MFFLVAYIFHMWGAFRCKIFPAVEATMGQDLQLSLKGHSCVIWKGMLIGRREMVQGSGTRFIYGDLLFWVSWVPFCVKPCMQINADWKELPCICNDMLNEVNMSTVNTMNKVTLTRLKCSKHPCFLLGIFFVLLSPREFLECGTSGPAGDSRDLSRQGAAQSSSLSKATTLEAEGTASSGEAELWVPCGGTFPRWVAAVGAYAVLGWARPTGQWGLMHPVTFRSSPGHFCTAVWWDRSLLETLCMPEQRWTFREVLQRKIA